MFGLSFGERFKALRKEKGLKQQELCDDFYKVSGRKLSKSSISQYEKNKRKPEINTLMDLADYFEVTVDYLLLGTYRDRFFAHNSSIHDYILYLSELFFKNPDIPQREKDIVFKEICMLYFDFLGI